MFRGWAGARPGGAPGDDFADDPDDGSGDDRSGHDGLAADPGDHHDPDHPRDHTDHHHLPCTDDREAPDDPAPLHSHPQTLTTPGAFTRMKAA